MSSEPSTRPYWAVYPPGGSVPAALFLDEAPGVFANADGAIDQARRWQSKTYGLNAGRLAVVSVSIEEGTPA